MKSWYTIRARTSGSEVLIYDEIGAYGVTAKGFLAELGALPDDAAIDLRLNSPGGSVFDAVAIYNALKRHAGAGGYACGSSFVDAARASWWLTGG